MGPNYSYNGMVCGIWEFRQHVQLVFFKGAAMKDHGNIFTEGHANKNNRGIKFSSLEEIEKKTLTEYVREAIEINLKGIKPVEKDISISANFKKALEKANALERFEKTGYTNRKEYVRWIESTKK